MFDWFGTGIVLLATLLFGLAAFRARRAKRVLIRWGGSFLAAIAALAGLIIMVAALRGYWLLNRRHDNPASSLTVDVTPERIARGERFATLCAGCHAEDQQPPLVGQNFLADGGAPPIGTFYAPNLTPTHLGEWTDGEIVRAIREGVHRRGRSLLIMPSAFFRHLSDEDAADIVAYLRAQPPVDPDTPPARLNLLGAILVNTAPLFSVQRPITEPVLAPPRGATAEYGAYLASFTCQMCHGADLGGDPDANAPGLIAAGTAWSEDDFLAFFATGTKPDGASVDGEMMPWEQLAALFGDEGVQAAFRYLQRHFGASGS